MRRSLIFLAAVVLGVPAAAEARITFYEVTSTITGREVFQPTLNGFTGVTSIADGILEPSQRFVITLAYGSELLPPSFDYEGSPVPISYRSDGLALSLTPTWGSGFYDTMRYQRVADQIHIQSLTFRGLQDFVSTRYGLETRPGDVYGRTAPNELLNLPSPELYGAFANITLTFEDGALAGGVPEALPLDQLLGVTAEFGFTEQDAGARIDISLGDAAIQLVPEPQTWALLILGFGLTGASLRKAKLSAA